MNDEQDPSLDENVDATGAMAALVADADRDAAYFPTGFATLDRHGMVSAGELALIWARSSCGKTTLALNIVARSPHVPTMIVSQEMPAARIAGWLLCMVNTFPFEARQLDDVLKGNNGPSWQRLAMDAVADFPRRFPHFNIKRSAKPPDVGTLMRLCDDIAIDTEVAPQRVIIDHLGLLANARDYEGMSTTTAALKSWAMRDELSVWAIQQTGRSGDAKSRNDGHLPVTLSSGVYAGEHDADMIYGMYRPDKDPKFRENEHGGAWEAVKGKTWLSIVKNRATGITDLTGKPLAYDIKSRRFQEPGELLKDIPGMETK